MVGRIEKAYGRLLRIAIMAINPIKRMIIRAECKVHILINFAALIILKNDGFIDAHTFFSDNIEKLNEGVVWADQDLKSVNHFYNPIRRKGLYGNNNAMSLGIKYYNKALRYWDNGDIDKSMIYLGAAVHIVQDMTVPQHANIRLLDNHRQYENFIRRRYINIQYFTAESGGYYMRSIQDFIRCNARNSIKIYRKLRNIKSESRRFNTITKFTLPLAQKTTAGCLMMFYRDAARKGRRASEFNYSLNTGRRFRKHKSY